MSDCWIYTGYKNKRGYGSCQMNGKYIAAHRASWILHHGSIPRNKFVLHLCNNPSCVNPEHLHLGDHKDNANDRAKSGRTAKGEKNGQSKLNWVKVSEIRELHQIGAKLYQIAKDYSVSDNLVSRIVRNKIWKI